MHDDIVLVTCMHGRGREVALSFFFFFIQLWHYFLQNKNFKCPLIILSAFMCVN